MSQEIITPDGEVVTTTALASLDAGLVSEMTRVEIDMAIATARRYPRSIKRASEAITSLATLNEDAAEDCIYALPRGGKPIRGPSVRLAEIIAQQWGNNRVAARLVNINRTEKYVECEAVFHDLETNAATKATVQRRIVDSRGRLYSDDMILVTANAANSIARRNAILAAVPKAVWNAAYQEAEGIIKGDVQTLSERRAKAVAAFGTWGVKPEQVYAALGVAGEVEVTLEHIPTLRGMFAALKNGESTVEELFAAKRDPMLGSDKPLASNPLRDTPSAASPPLGSSPSPAAQDAAVAAPAPNAAADAEAGCSPASATLPEQSDGVSTTPRSSPASDSGGATPGVGGAADSTPPAPPIHPDEQARQRGADAARAGRSRKAMPPEFKDADRLPEGNAWLQGYDDAMKEIKA